MTSVMDRITVAVRALLSRTPPGLAKVLHLGMRREPSRDAIIARLDALWAEVMEMERMGQLTKPRHLRLVPRQEEVGNGS